MNWRVSILKTRWCLLWLGGEWWWAIYLLTGMDDGLGSLADTLLKNSCNFARFVDKSIRSLLDCVCRLRLTLIKASDDRADRLGARKNWCFRRRALTLESSSQIWEGVGRSLGLWAQHFSISAARSCGQSAGNAGRSLCFPTVTPILVCSVSGNGVWPVITSEDKIPKL